MWIRAAGVMVLLVLPALVFPGRARACDPVTPMPYTMDPAMAGVDQTPPQLAQPSVTEVQRFEQDQGACQMKCGWDNGATLTNLATDDMTPVEKIGYRLTTVAGTAPAVAFWSGENPICAWTDGKLVLYWDGDADFDFTLQVVAIDLAGNESAPQTVRLHHESGGCSVARGRARGGLTLVVAALALAGAAARRPRRRR